MVIPAPVSQTFGALLVNRGAISVTNFNGEMLSLDLVSGTKGQTGAVSECRVSAGVYDLVYSETIELSDPPHRLVVSQTPLDLWPYDPAERLPPIGSDRPTDDGSALFARLYGPVPPLDRFEATLEPHENGTSLTIAVSTHRAKPLGWFGRRQVAGTLTAYVAATCKKIAARV